MCILLRYDQSRVACGETEEGQGTSFTLTVPRDERKHLPCGASGQARRRQDAEQARLTGGPWLGLLLGLPWAREAAQFRSC